MTAQTRSNLIQIRNSGYRVSGDQVFASRDYDFPVGVFLKNNRIEISYASHPAQIYDADRFREFCEKSDILFVEQASHEFVIKNIKEHIERFSAVARRLEARIENTVEQP